MRFLLAAALVSIMASAQKTLPDSISFSVNYDADTDEAVFTTVQPDGSWFGILPGSASMTGADCIIFMANGASSSAKDYYSSSNGEPSLDST